MKQILLILLILLTLPLISACGIVTKTVGTAVNIIKIPVDLLTLDETHESETPDDTALALTE